jgi:hypothetical protein
MVELVEGALLMFLVFVGGETSLCVAEYFAVFCFPVLLEPCFAMVIAETGQIDREGVELLALVWGVFGTRELLLPDEAGNDLFL